MKNANNGQAQIIGIEVNGIKYTQTRPGYYYKNVDGKQTRIPKAEWEQAFDEYTQTASDNAEQDAWQAEADAEKQAREQKQADEDKMAEKTMNKQTKVKKPAYEIESLWDGDTTSYSLYIKGELEGRYWSYEEADKVGKEKTKKAPRKSKDIAYEGNDVTLTAKQVRFIKRMPEDDFYEHGLDSALWIDVFCDTIADEFNPMAVGAMVSTLREKKLLVVDAQKLNGKKCKYMAFTEIGKQVAKELGLN